MVIFSLCLLLFINSMSIGLVFPIFAPMFTQGHDPFFSENTALATQNFYFTMILAIPTFCMVFGAPFWGRMSDKIGRKNILMIGLVGVTLSFLLSACGIFLGNLFILFSSRALAGFMDGSESVAQATIVDLSDADKKVRNMGLATFAGTIGFIIGPVVGGFLAEPAITGQFHYQIPFFVSSALSLINLVTLFIWLPKSSKITIQDDLKTGYTKLLIKGFSFCFDKRVRIYSFLLFLVHFVLASFYQLSVLLLAERYKYSSAQLGFFTTFLGLCFSISILIVIHILLKKMSHLRMLKSGIILLGISMLIGVYFHNSSLFAWITVIPIMLGIAMMYNILLVFVSNSATEGEQGEAMGTGTALKAIAWLISGLLVSGVFPNMAALLSLMLAFIIISFFCSFYLKNVPIKAN